MQLIVGPRQGRFRIPLPCSSACFLNITPLPRKSADVNWGEMLKEEAEMRENVKDKGKILSKTPKYIGGGGWQIFEFRVNFVMPKRSK
jgi:hypothetical protein